MIWLSKRVVQGLHRLPTAHWTKHFGQMRAEQSLQVSFVLEWSQVAGTRNNPVNLSERTQKRIFLEHYYGNRSSNTFTCYCPNCEILDAFYRRL